MLTMIESICLVLFACQGAQPKDCYRILPLNSTGRDVQHAQGSSPVLMSLQQSVTDFGSMKIDEYGDISVQEERERLDDFAKQLRAQPSDQAYIIAYAGRRSWRGEAKARAHCAKNYLVTRQGIAKGRIVTIDGGYQDEPIVSLYIKMANAEPPSAFPTVDAGKVEIIKSHRSKDQPGACRPPK